ncbi:hypothetical protein HUG17_5611 [Dermatophagoides farinae]|uniref:Paired domain-containing protein n=1 Tax=Dermatophagoides farinae TaxID=6954 RepID=A0A9D4P0L3_DERFA|nr:hypothetical protein HUG17_5611 [Dermatophagoides farinae]
MSPVLFSRFQVFKYLDTIQNWSTVIIMQSIESCDHQHPQHQHSIIDHECSAASCNLWCQWIKISNTAAVDMNNISTNQLGGSFSNGKPLPFDSRLQILAMSLKGYRPCDISRRLLVSHGCVSKILAKFHKTGSILPGTIGGSKPRVSTPLVTKKIYEYKLANNSLYAWEIREKLRHDRICSQDNLPNNNNWNLEQRTNTMIKKKYKNDINNSVAYFSKQKSIIKAKKSFLIKDLLGMGCRNF